MQVMHSFKVWQTTEGAWIKGAWLPPVAREPKLYEAHGIMVDAAGCLWILKTITLPSGFPEKFIVAVLAPGQWYRVEEQ
jgi:hypothetical protein